MLKTGSTINKCNFSDNSSSKDPPKEFGAEVYQFFNNTWPLTKSRKPFIFEAEKDAFFQNFKSSMYDDGAKTVNCLNDFSEDDYTNLSHVIESPNPPIPNLSHDFHDKYDVPLTTSDSSSYGSNNYLMDVKIKSKHRCKSKKPLPISKASNKLIHQPRGQSSETLWETLKPNYHFLMGHELMDQCMEARGFLKDDLESVNSFSYNKWLDMYETTLDLILLCLKRLGNQQSQPEFLYCLKNKIHLICENGNAICQRYPELENEIGSKLDLLKENWHSLINDGPKTTMTRFNDLRSELMCMLQSIDIVENAVNAIIQRHIPTSDITQLHSELLEFHKKNVISQNVKVSALIFRCLKYQEMITGKAWRDNSCDNDLMPPLLPAISPNTTTPCVVLPRSPRSIHCSPQRKTSLSLAINKDKGGDKYYYGSDDEQTIATLAKLLESRWNKIRLFSLELILIVESKIKAKSYHLKLNDYHNLLRPNERELPHLDNAYPKRSIVAAGGSTYDNNDPITLYQNCAIESIRLRDDTFANYHLCKTNGLFNNNILSLTKERIILWSNQRSSETFNCNKDGIAELNCAMRKHTQNLIGNGRCNEDEHEDDTLITTNSTTITTNRSTSHITTEYEDLHGPTSYFDSYPNSYRYPHYNDAKGSRYNSSYKCTSPPHIPLFGNVKFVAKEESSLIKEEKFEEVIVKKHNEDKNFRIKTTKPRAQINLTCTFPYPNQHATNQNLKSKAIPVSGTKSFARRNERGDRKRNNDIEGIIALDDASGEGSSISTKFNANKKKIARRVSHPPLHLLNYKSRKFEKYAKSNVAYQNQRRTSFLNFISYVNSFKGGDKHDNNAYIRLIDSYDRRNDDLVFEKLLDEVYKSDVCSSTSSYKQQISQFNNPDAPLQTVDSLLNDDYFLSHQQTNSSLNGSLPYNDNFIGVDSFTANQNQWFTPEYLTTISPSYSSIRSNKISGKKRIPVSYTNDPTDKSSSEYSEFMWDPYQAPLYPHTDSNEGRDEDTVYSYSRYKKTLGNLKKFCLNKKKRSKSHEDLSYPDSVLMLDSDDEIEDLRSLLSLSKKDLRDVKHTCNYYESKNSPNDDININQKLSKFIDVCQIHLSFLQTVVDSISDYNLTKEEKNQTFILCDHWRQLCYKLENNFAQNQQLAINAKTAIIHSDFVLKVPEHKDNVTSLEQFNRQICAASEEYLKLQRLSNIKRFKNQTSENQHDTCLDAFQKIDQSLANINQVDNFESKKLRSNKGTNLNSFLTLTRISSFRVTRLSRCIKYCLVVLFLLQMLFWLSKPTCCENRNNYKSSLFFFLNYPHGSPPK